MPRMAATRPSSAAASPLLLRHTCAALSVSFRRRKHWQCVAARRDDQGAQLALPGERWLPPAAADGGKRASGAAAAAAAGEAPYGGSKGQGSLGMVLLSTAVAVCGSFEFGTCVGYSAPAQAGIMGDIGLSNSQYGVFASVLTIGGMVGAVTSGSLADTFGRKLTMRLAAAISIFGWLSVYLAKDAMMLYAGRVLLGYCTGVLSYVVPVFISEIAPKEVRGGLATSNQVRDYGAEVVHLFRMFSFLHYWCIPFMAFFGFSRISTLCYPSYRAFRCSRVSKVAGETANMGRETEFQVSLQKLRGEDSDISGEATEIKDYTESVRSLPKARIQDLFQRKNIYAVTVGVGLMIFQQLGGINALGFYMSYIFSSAGFSGKLGTVLIGVIQIPITLLGALLMDRSGRRALLLVSSSGTFLGCFLTGLSFYFKAQGLYLQLVPSLALCGILVYYAAYSVGVGPVSWVIMSEIFSVDMKAIAGSLVTLVSWIGSFGISYSFNFLMDWNSAGTFFLFSAASLVTVLFVGRLVPETKGRTLEEIQELLKART